MAVNYSNLSKTSLANALISLIGNGATLELCTASYGTVLATFPIGNGVGTVSNGVITFAGFPATANASATGTATLGRVKNSAGTVLYDGLTVGVSSADINFNTNSFQSGVAVTINSLTHTVQ